LKGQGVNHYSSTKKFFKVGRTNLGRKLDKKEIQCKAQSGTQENIAVQQLSHREL